MSKHSSVENGVQFTLSFQQLAALLNLPDGSVITSVFDEHDWVDEKIRIFVRHPDMPPRKDMVSKEVGVLITECSCGHNTMHFKEIEE